MKSFGLVFFSLVLFFGLTSFSNLPNAETINKDMLVGTWVYKTYKDGKYVYSKSSDFKSSKPGYKFEADGKMVKRMDPHYCLRVGGKYANTDGSWKDLGDDKIMITYNCYDKSHDSKYQVVELTKSKLILKSLPRD